jgi:AraC-like DNA-binding protein
MKPPLGSHVIPAFEIEALPRSVYLRSEQLAPGEVFEVHSHPWNQLVYATAGSLVVILSAMRYVITPAQAIWLPTGTVHAAGSPGGASFRSLYIADGPDLDMPRDCKVLAVSPLLQALIVELNAITGQGEDSAYLDHVDALILAQLQRARIDDFSLPWPQSPQLSQLCQALYDDPGDERTAAQWGRQLAITPRTLARRFEPEVGMTLREWRRRLRLFRALEWLGAGRGVTQVALDLGYASPSAFAFMFRQEMGCSPIEWQKGAFAARI